MSIWCGGSLLFRFLDDNYQEPQWITLKLSSMMNPIAFHNGPNTVGVLFCPMFPVEY